MAGVLEHLPDPAGTLDRIMGWLRPGGLVYIDVPNARWLASRLVNLAYRLQGLDYVANLSPMHVPYHLYEFTRESFDAAAKQGGYEVVAEWTHTADYNFLPALLDALLRPIMRRTETGLQLEIWLRKLEAERRS